jgi:hypothetical protein
MDELQKMAESPIKFRKFLLIEEIVTFHRPVCFTTLGSPFGHKIKAYIFSGT